MGLVAEMRSGFEQLLHGDDVGRHLVFSFRFKPRRNKSPASRPAPVCQFRLWNAARPSRTAPPFQPLADGDEQMLDK
jgi:hypothetical protein